MQIFGIPIDNLSRAEILSRVKDYLAEPGFHRIATINPEFLLRAAEDQDFNAALRAADLRIADGFGIVLAGLLRGKCIARFPGADLMQEILSIAEERKLSVYLAVRQDGLSSYEEISATLLKKYPSLKLSGADIDPQIPATQVTAPTTIVLCNFGAPEQELFLAHLKNREVPPRLVMGVGGSFDYLTGKQKRAPEWLRAIGLEWLWRLILQPTRWKRIWHAVVVFPFRMIFATIKK
jgi:N-acetylglucosaminyldiphosphoundecaprenol N-acetyl-beta-D-mannosaminyltransferase